MFDPSTPSGEKIENLAQRAGLINNGDDFGHYIDLSGNTVSCSICDESKAVPEIIQASSGFRTVVYKLFLYANFKQTPCHPSADDSSDITDGIDIGVPNNGIDDISPVPNSDPYYTTKRNQSYTPDSNNYDVNLSAGDSVSVDGIDFVYRGGNRWYVPKYGNDCATSQLIHHFGQEFIDKVRAKSKFSQRNNIGSLNTSNEQFSTTGIHNVDTHLTSDNGDQSSDSDENLTTAEKLAKKVSESDLNPLLR